MQTLNTKQIMINFMVKSMLNPSNKSFYIGSLTLDKLNRIINGDSEIAEVIFTAFGIAQAQYLHTSLLEIACRELSIDYTNREDRQTLIDYSNQECKKFLFEDYVYKVALDKAIEYDNSCCPECGCPNHLGYTIGATCPNCEYVEC